jgi:hypothetical protein
MMSKLLIDAPRGGFMRRSKLVKFAVLGTTASLAVVVASAAPRGGDFDAEIARHAQTMFDEGRKIFRYDTFGSEVFWGDALHLHAAIAGEKNGGVGPGVSPKTALSVGLKVDADALPDALKQQIKASKVDIDDPATTIALLKLNAVVGVTAFANALRPDGKQVGTLIPPAFGLAGVNLATWTGFGSVTYWNAYVAGTQMHGAATFFDARFNNTDQYPVSAKSGSGNTRNTPDKTTAKLAALHFYQLSIPAPKALAGSYDKTAFERGKTVFNGSGKCATCHVPPLFTEPGNNLHAPAEIGVDSFQADRSPTHMYRTAPLAGLWTHQNSGFYHDGRFATLLDVVNHYDTEFNLKLSDTEKRDLIEYLKGI